MNQQVRLSYMKAMGIPVWAARSASAYNELPNTLVENETIKPVQKDQLSALNLIDALDQAPPQQTTNSKKSTPETPTKQAPTLQTPKNNSTIATLQWEQLQQTVEHCQHCEMHRIRSNTVFGSGSQAATWMIIGEAPDVKEDAKGSVFLGKAGQLLDNILSAIDLKREDVYLTNVLKCRPPNDRDPQIEEVNSCISYLQRQIELVQPKVIIVVGRMATLHLLQLKEPLNKMRGKVHHLPKSHMSINPPVIVTYHPRYLLRQPSAKRRVWEDIKLARSLI